MKKNSKRHQKNKKNVLNKEAYSLSDAVKTIKGITKAKFDETVEVAVILNKEKSKGEGKSSQRFLRHKEATRDF